jgi:hypothetical protein
MHVFGLRLMPVLALLLLLPLAVACGNLKPEEQGDGGAAGTGAAGANGPVLVTVSGRAAAHPLNAQLGATEDFSMLQVAVVDPLATISNPTAPPLGQIALDTSAANCDATGCAFSLAGVDISKQTLGLVGSLEDKRAAGARLWVKTGTGLGTKEFVAAVKKAPAPITDRRAFAVSRKLEAKLAAFVTTVLGATLTADALEARGYLIGHIVGRLSEGTPDPVPVAGATLVSAGTAGEMFDVVYPNALFTDKGTATSTSGIFLVVPKAAAPIVTSWNVVPPTGDTRRWEMSLAGTNPGSAFVVILPALEP